MNEEEALIRSFFVAAKQDRYVGFLAHPKRRAKATAALYHLHDLDSRWIVPVSGSQSRVAAIEANLRARGAGDSCHLISAQTELDGKRLPLAEALAPGRRMEGTILSCVPGKLAYYEGEDYRCILVRR